MGIAFIRSFLAVLTLIVATPCAAMQPLIYLSSALEEGTCQITAPPGQLTEFFILGDPEFFGLSGAEFRVVGLPPEWTVVAEPSPQAVISLGDPFVDGVNIAFATCSTDPVALLYTVSVMPSGPTTTALLAVCGHETPTNPHFTGAVITGCTIPGFSLVVASTTHFGINQTAPDCDIKFSTTSCQIVGVEQVHWGAVKSMYR